MIIKPFKIEDTQKLLTILQANIPQYFAPEEAEELAEYLTKHGDSYFTMKKNGKIIGGLGYVIKETEKEGHITWVFIYPDEAGKGLGKQAVQYCLEIVKSYKCVEKLVVRTSQFADKFFASLGYELLYIKKDYWAQGIDLYYMEINLHNESEQI